MGYNLINTSPTRVMKNMAAKMDHTLIWGIASVHKMNADTTWTRPTYWNHTFTRNVVFPVGAPPYNSPGWVLLRQALSVFPTRQLRTLFESVLLQLTLWPTSTSLTLLTPTPSLFHPSNELQKTDTTLWGFSKSVSVDSVISLFPKAREAMLVWQEKPPGAGL